MQVTVQPSPPFASGLPYYPPHAFSSGTYTFSSASLRPLLPQQQQQQPPLYMPPPAAFQPRVPYGYPPSALVPPPPPAQRLPEERAYSQPPAIVPRYMDPPKISPPFSSSSQQVPLPSRPLSASPYERPAHLRQSSAEGSHADRTQWPYPQPSYQSQAPRQQHQQDPADEILAEKRRRNAGASARFRDRRKQREQETLNNCRRLQKELDDLKTKSGYNTAVQEGITQWKARFDELEAENTMLKNLLTRNNIPFDEVRGRNRSMSFKTQSTSDDDDTSNLD